MSLSCPWLRGAAIGFFGLALLVACTGFLVALARAVQQSIPCACFGRLGRTSAGGREIGRGIALLAGSGSCVFTLAQRSDCVEAIAARLDLPASYERFVSGFASTPEWRPSTS